METLTGAPLATVEADDQPRRESWRRRGAAFFQRRSRNPASEPDRSQALRRAMAARWRHEACGARTGTRAWALTRRARTRQLIELGGLVAKAGLVDLTGDDRAVLYGAYLAVAVRLSGDGRERVLQLWADRGRESFQADETKRWGQRRP